MRFASTSLAARIEWAECRLLEDGVSACKRRHPGAARVARSGCDVAVVTTQPGSKSQENLQRQGFELLYTRAVLVRSA